MFLFPEFTMLVGIPGSGKSEYAERLKEDTTNSIVLSSDKFREELLGDINDQTRNEFIFHSMKQKAVEYLKQGKNVIFDATNINRKDRMNILKLLPPYVLKRCQIVWAPVELCIQRDSSRDRSVGKDVIDKMLRGFQPPFFDEGFEEIEIAKCYKDTNNMEWWSSQYTYQAHFNDIDMEQNNSHHEYTLKQHMEMCEKIFIQDFPFDSDLQIAARFHDIGKVYTKKFEDSKGNPSEEAHYYGHQGYSAWLAYGLSLGYHSLAWLIGNHMDPYLNTKYYNNLPYFMKEKLDILHKCDVAAH